MHSKYVSISTGMIREKFKKPVKTLDLLPRTLLDPPPSPQYLQDLRIRTIFVLFAIVIGKANLWFEISPLDGDPYWSAEFIYFYPYWPCKEC